jgi:hypothetical protein
MTAGIAIPIAAIAVAASIVLARMRIVRVILIPYLSASEHPWRRHCGVIGCE